uniref:Uncharacterized protein n=1 Tax=Cacopsylla melanoneura TaxID=428564 RepID=A0A8D8WSA8_9HEMI
MDGLRRGEALGTETRPRASGMTKSYPLTAKSCAVNTLCTVYAEEKALSHRHDEELSLDGDILPDECTMDGLRREAIGTETRSRTPGMTKICPSAAKSFPVVNTLSYGGEYSMYGLRRGEALGPETRTRAPGTTKIVPSAAKIFPVNTECTVYGEDKLSAQKQGLESRPRRTAVP